MRPGIGNSADVVESGVACNWSREVSNDLMGEALELGL